MNFKKLLRDQRRAFTLAEVVIVMAILSIMMVAFAPVITKKSNTAADSFRTFQRAVGSHGIYYGTRRDMKPVVIGDNELRYNTGEGGYSPKLIIAATATGDTANSMFTPHVGFLAEVRKADNNTKYATGQLLVVGGYEYNEQVINNQPVLDDDNKTMNDYSPFLMPLAHAKAVDDTSSTTESHAYANVNPVVPPGDGSIGTYENPADPDAPGPAGISVVLGGNPIARYRLDAGKDRMTIIGGNACEGSTSGVTGLTCLGADTANNATLGQNAIYIGREAGIASNLGTGSINIGFKAGANSVGNGGENINIGHGAGSDRTSGANNVSIGFEAGTNKSVSNAVFIGANAGKGKVVENYDIYIGDSTHNLAISDVFLGKNSLGKLVCDLLGGDVQTSSCSLSNVIQQHAGTKPPASSMEMPKPFGNNIQLALMTGNDAAISSDERLKNVGKPFTSGLDLIEQIMPVNFTYKRDENKLPHVGVVAQDLMKIIPNAVNANKDGYLYIRTEDMFYAAINAIKELHQLFLEHDKRIKQLEARNAVLEQQNKELMELYTELSKRVERLDKKKSKDVKFTQMPVEEEAPAEAAE